MKKKLLLLFFTFLSCYAFAQERVVRGKVTDQDTGSDLPGVNVLVKGTVRGTVTDADGKYVIQVNPGDDVLVFSFIGMLPLEVSIGTRDVVDVTMKADVTELS